MNILKNLSWIFFANVIASLSKWLMIILIAKSLSSTEVGVYSLALALGAPITLFANMKLRSLYITSTNQQLSDYISSRNILSLIALLILSTVGSIFYTEYFIIIVLVGISKIIDLQSDLYYALPHKNNELNIVGKILILKNVFSILLFGTFLLIFENLTFALFAQVIFYLIFLIMEKRYLLNHYKTKKDQPSWMGIKAILVLGLPLGLSQMLYSLNVNFSRYILEYYESSEVLGYFSAIVYILIVSNLFMSAISQVFLPKLSTMFENGNIVLFKKYVYHYLSFFSIIVGIFMIGLAIVFGEVILTILYGKEYAVYKNIFLLCTISTAVNLISWNVDTALMAMRYVSIQPKITLVNLFITIISGYMLISNYGIKGAALTLIISATFQLILRIYFVNKRLNSIQKKA
ncbi:hypothetical protein M9R32_08700 [Paenisporosarcina quisquiliarum]|uniref:Membrane protein involved in the export of O-antigen and teichoic acid n=1 Tax=Paenisporosarcina quisquiliarum TaxID=365346 RepID=A0A9X3RD68_9BACL|nr:oligosaccharide flippase family protein [Paenisporosarcina quisquiliarum]MCZ8537256.1 hypothetical protein [Paenisporosarcina quisquiliarum]